MVQLLLELERLLEALLIPPLLLLLELRTRWIRRIQRPSRGRGDSLQPAGYELAIIYIKSSRRYMPLLTMHQ